MAKGIKVDRFLRPIEGESVYSELKNTALNILKKAYEFGFTDVDQQLPGGYTPLLSTHCSSSELPNYQLELLVGLFPKARILYKGFLDQLRQ